MKRLNYYDLLALLVEFDIDNLDEYIRQLRSQQNADKKRNVKIATNEDILKLHRKGVN